MNEIELNEFWAMGCIYSLFISAAEIVNCYTEQMHKGPCWQIKHRFKHSWLARGHNILSKQYQANEDFCILKWQFSW